MSRSQKLDALEGLCSGLSDSLSKVRCPLEA